MTRNVKQFTYSILYIGVFLLIFFVIWSIATKKEPTCFDGVRNQNETAIDCGGMCIACDLKNIQPIEVLGRSVISLKSGKSAMLIHVRNLNSAHHAVSFVYHVRLIDEDGIEREVFDGASMIQANSEGYIVRQDIQYKNPYEVDISFSDIDWKKKDFVNFPNVLLRNFEIQKNDSVIKVRGVVENTSSRSAGKTRIIAILGGAYGEDVYVSETSLTRVPAFSKEEFYVSFPKDPEIASRLKNEKTRVIVQVEEQ